MEIFTSKHGLTPLRPSQGIDQTDIGALPPQLQQELHRLQGQFTVDTRKLKDITQRFEAELQDCEILGK